MLSIKDIYYSDVSALHLTLPNDKEYTDIQKKYFELNRQIAEQLTDDQLKLHNQIIDVVGQMNALSNAAHYTQGFRDGASIMLDVILR